MLECECCQRLFEKDDIISSKVGENKIINVCSKCHQEILQTLIEIHQESSYRNN